MTKVVAPLGSFSASGKIGKALVFFSHLGRNVVRGLVTPQNPKTVTQGDSRLLLGALGRAAKPVASTSLFLASAKFSTPAGQTWVSNLIRSSINDFGSGTVGVAALIAAAAGHTKAAVFTAQAALLGITAVSVSYAEVDQTSISGGAILYALARHASAMAAQDPTNWDRAPYTTALASWSTANITAFVDDIGVPA